MIRLLLALLLACGTSGAVLLASPAWGAIAFVSESDAPGTGVTTISITMTINAGDTVVVVGCELQQVAKISSIADTGGSTYTQKVIKTDLVNDPQLEIWGTLSASASTSITVTFTGNVGNTTGIAVLRYTGVSAFGTTQTTGPTTSTNPSISLTTQDANNYVVAGLEDRLGIGHVSNTIQTGTFRLSPTVWGGGSQTCAVIENTAASAQSVTASYTYTVTANAWDGVAVELRAPASTQIRHRAIQQ